MVEKMHQSVWDIKQALAHERQAIKALEQSSKHWNDITDDLRQGVNNITTTGNEWKIRYAAESDRLPNETRIYKSIQSQAEILSALMQYIQT